MNIPLRTLWIVTSLFCLTACAPKIVSFQVSPGRLCKGQNTVVSWEVKGHALLYADPRTDGTGAVPSFGSENFTLVKPTKFTIIAMRSGKDVYAEQEVVVLSSGDTKPIAFRTKPDGKGGLVATETLNPEVWDDTMRIDIISSQSQRNLRVLHDGHEVVLSANGSASDQMRGAKISGVWEVHADLLPGEVIGDPAHAPPDRLHLLITPMCISKE